MLQLIANMVQYTSHLNSEFELRSTTYQHSVKVTSPTHEPKSAILPRSSGWVSQGEPLSTFANVKSLSLNRGIHYMMHPRLHNVGIAKLQLLPKR